MRVQTVAILADRAEEPLRALDGALQELAAGARKGTEARDLAANLSTRAYVMRRALDKLRADLGHLARMPGVEP